MKKHIYLLHALLLTATCCFAQRQITNFDNGEDKQALSPLYQAQIGSRKIFSSFSPASGNELWVSDGANRTPISAPVPAAGQSLYSRAFGKATDDPVIFMHGGPGSSAVYFEATTAQKLVDEGFYVVIYDRRGEGRSLDTTAKMNYEEYFEDLNGIYQKYHLTRAHLIGFSFGGLVTTLFTEKYPEKVKSVILTSALVSQQESYNTILNSAGHIYQSRNDTTNFQAISKVRAMDTNSIAYRTEVFAHASRNGFFSLPNPDPEAQRIYETYKTDTLIRAYIKNERAVETFWRNEERKNIDVSPALTKLAQAQVPIYAIYGKQDGLYANVQIAALQKITGKSRLKYLDNCSHTVFIDQQAQFLETVTKWLKPTDK